MGLTHWVMFYFISEESNVRNVAIGRSENHLLRNTSEDWVSFNFLFYFSIQFLALIPKQCNFSGMCFEKFRHVFSNILDKITQTPNNSFSTVCLEVGYQTLC